MKIQFWSVGKNHEGYLKSGIEDYTKRISNYYPVEWNIISPPRVAGVLHPTDLKKKEAEIILQQLKKEDWLVVLDEKGKIINTDQLAAFISLRANESTKQLVFLIGGSFGLDSQLLQKARLVWSLSALTFPHQLVRLILSEQIYRACTIIRNEKYHHP